MKRDLLARLQEWYDARCDGDWEHTARIRIQTIDNPGWSVWINLDDTYEVTPDFERVEVERTSRDWYRCWLHDGVFHAAGGAGNLDDMLAEFLSWIEELGTRDGGGRRGLEG